MKEIERPQRQQADPVLTKDSLAPPSSALSPGGIFITVLAGELSGLCG